MFLDAIVRLYDYQREVNGHILDVAEQLSNDELTSVIVEGQPSIRDTLFHLFDVIESHFAFWDYDADGILPASGEVSPGDFPSVGSLKILATTVNERVDIYIRSLTSSEDLDRKYVRGFPDGSSNQRIRWEMLWHVINHSTQHRSEVAMMLTKLGHSPGDMEIL